MARTKALFFIISLAWIFLVMASRGLVSVPQSQPVGVSSQSPSEVLVKAMSSRRNPAQVAVDPSVNSLTSPALQWTIEPLTREDHSLLNQRKSNRLLKQLP